MENKKQTAVEWLEQKLKTYCLLTISVKADFEKAKEMERQQIENAYIEASPNWFDIAKVAAEQYYNENHK